eukprot:TRINITY_DN1214_c0_g1_i1.p1 TRINITY_DN1214_c0_g1~~TRINITY_DN1214_c0_g1_i1.p1  ORF type:complete len:644 (-),score=151.19 TRINITY_DN1214_c0_g1_i1:94-2025(-)
MGVKCCMPATDALGRKPSELAGTELPTFGVDELSNAIVSTMRIELRIRCEGLPSSFLAQEKSLLYKVELGNGQQVLKWSQKLETNSESRFSNAYILPYEMGTNNDIKASLYSFEGGKESDSRVLYGTATMSLDEAILAQDNTVRSKVAVVDKAHAEEETYVALQVGEKKQETFAQLTVQLEVSECGLKGPLYYACYQRTSDGTKLIYQSEMVEERKARVFTFHPLILSSENFEGKWEDKTLSFDFEDASRKPDKQRKQIAASCTAAIKNLITMQNQVLPVDKRDAKFGTLNLRHRSFENIITLGDILFSEMRFVPVIAVDCSLGNLTFDSLKCMHHFDKIRPNYYIEALKAVESRVAPFYSRMFAYGFGAKVVPKRSKLTDCFSLNGNIFNPSIRNKDELVESYVKSIKKVELCLPVNYTGVIKVAKEMAQLELKRFAQNYNNAKHMLSSMKAGSLLRNYYVLYILTAGVLDDPEEAFLECLSIPELPLSIVFIKIGNQQMKDVDDLGELKKRLEQYQSQKRKFVSLVEFDRVYNDLENFGKFLISGVPTQVLQFLKAAPNSVNKGKERGSAKNVRTKEEEKFDLPEKESFEEYFDAIKMKYSQKMCEKSIADEDIERAIKDGIPDDDPDLPLGCFKIAKGES